MAVDRFEEWLIEQNRVSAAALREEETGEWPSRAAQILHVRWRVFHDCHCKYMELKREGRGDSDG